MRWLANPFLSFRSGSHSVEPRAQLSTPNNDGPSAPNPALESPDEAREQPTYCPVRICHRNSSTARPPVPLTRSLGGYDINRYLCDVCAIPCPHPRYLR
jgi:hypothetical protein